MKKTNSELLSTQLGTEKNQNNTKSSELIEREVLAEGPIVIMGNSEKGYAPCIGLHRLTKWYATKEEAKETALSLDWEFLVNLISAITEDVIKQKDNTLKTNSL